MPKKPSTIPTVALSLLTLLAAGVAMAEETQRAGSRVIYPPLLGAFLSTANGIAESAGEAAAPRAQDGGGGQQGEGGAPGGEDVQDNGTNPASLGFKFMPYYRYTELNNGVKATDELTLFTMIGLPKISPFSALVLEWPVQKTLDFGAVVEDGLRAGMGLPAAIPCAPPTCGGALPVALPVEGVARGFRVTGVGDFRLRYLQGIKMIPGKKPGAATILMVGADVMLPFASDPILGDETYYGSPIFAHIHNINPSTFFAFLHFYFFDWSEKSGAHPINQDKEIGFYMGRWFFQKAWPKSGYYMLPEVQAIHDDKSDDEWSFMFLPEFGKSFQAGGTGMTAYIKPGWAIDGPDAGERRFSVEFGFRMIP